MESNRFMGMTEATVFAIGIPVVFLMIAIQVLMPIRAGHPHYTRDDTPGTLGLLIGNVIVALLAQSLSIALRGMDAYSDCAKTGVP